MNLQTAVDELKNQGLTARIVSEGNRSDILGGTGLTGNTQMQLLITPFMILDQTPKWISTIPGPASYHTVLKQTHDLAEAVQAICDFYNSTETEAYTDTETYEDALLRLEGVGLKVDSSHSTDKRIWCTAKADKQGVTTHVVIFAHGDTWVAVEIKGDELPELITYSRSFAKTVDTIIHLCSQN